MLGPRATAADTARRRVARAALRLVAVLVLAALGVACGTDTESAGTTASPTASSPLALVAYQGEDVLGGKEVEFTDVLGRGKPVVLNFWAGLCAPCRAEMPSFQAVYKRYEGRITLVGVDVGPFLGLGSHEDAAALLKSLGITYPSAYAVNPAILKRYELVAMPMTVFFDASGAVVKKHIGLMTEAQLEQEFKALAASGG